MSALKIGLIGGTGLGDALGTGPEGTRHEIDTPFGKPSDAIVEKSWGDATVYILSRHGPGHLINPSSVPYRANIFALKQLGVTHILASGAVGSLREEFKPTELLIPNQVIDKTYRRAGTFYDAAAVHVEFAEPFCPVLRQLLVDASAELATKVHPDGCYVCMEGPAFSSRAESLMHRLWGGDLIGMTAMPEAKLAREAEISYALVALITDYDCWKAPPAEHSADSAALLAEIIGNLTTATGHAVELMKSAVNLMISRQEQLLAAPAQSSLKLAIWSDKRKLPPAEIDRLAPLWGRYFST